MQGTWKANTYAEVNRIWKKGDCVEWVMDMPVKLLEANPLAEEIRNQVVVKRGPLVYCLESMDIEGVLPVWSMKYHGKIPCTAR